MKLEEFPLNDLKYKRGWMFYMEDPTEECPVYKFFIISDTANSYDEDKRIRVKHEFMVPPADYLEEVWLAWIFDRIGDVEAKHEAGEFFMYKGVRIFAPHHGNGQDPYRVWFMGDYRQTRTKSGHYDPPKE